MVPVVCINFMVAAVPCAELGKESPTKDIEGE
jgi:hypothetical protein